MNEEVRKMVFDKAKEFLEANGFIEGKGSSDMMVFRGEKCSVFIHKAEEPYYEITFIPKGLDSMASAYTNNTELPGLLGILLWHDLIDKDFKKV